MIVRPSFENIDDLLEVDHHLGDWCTQAFESHRGNSKRNEFGFSLPSQPIIINCFLVRAVYIGDRVSFCILLFSCWFFSKTIYLSVLIATLCSYVCSYAFLSLTQIHFIEKMMLKTILTGDRTSRSSSNLPFLSHLSWIHHECLWIFTCSCVQHNAFVVLAWTVSRLYIVLFKSQDFGFVFVITKRSCKA